jgi:AAA+ superfamily predicted ATPase
MDKKTKTSHKKAPMMAKKGTGSHGGRRGKWPAGATMPASVSFAESHKTIPANFIKTPTASAKSKTVTVKPVTHHKKATHSKVVKKASTTTKKKKDSSTKTHHTKAKAVHHHTNKNKKKSVPKKRRASAPMQRKTRRVSKVVYSPVPPPPPMQSRWKINKWMVLLAVLFIIGIALIILWRLGYFDPIATTAPSTGPEEGGGTTVSSEPASSGWGRTIGILVVSFVVFIGVALLARRLFSRGRQMSSAEEELRAEINGNISRVGAGDIYINSQALLNALINNDELTEDEKESVINRMLEVLTTKGMKKNMKLKDLIAEVSDAVENDFPESLGSDANVQLAFMKARLDLPLRPGAEDLLDVGEYAKFASSLNDDESEAWSVLMRNEFKRRKSGSIQGDFTPQEKTILESAKTDTNQLRSRTVPPSFGDIIGLPKTVLRSMRDNKKFGLPGGTERILLFGPAGTGKSQSVFAAAVEHDALILNIGGTELSAVQGGVDKRIRDTFSLANKLMAQGQPAVVFLDEIDGLLASSDAAKNELQKQIQNSENVTVVAATNYKDKLPGPILSRFTTKVEVDRPDTAARKKIIESRLKDVIHNLTAAERTKISKLKMDGRELTNMLNNEFARVAREVEDGKDAQVTYEGLKEQFRSVKKKTLVASTQRKADRAAVKVRSAFRK